VTKKTFNGSIAGIDPFFRGLVNRYCRLIFPSPSASSSSPFKGVSADSIDGPSYSWLEPKIVNGRYITAQELSAFFEVYAALFTGLGAEKSSFPKVSSRVYVI
jgi:hypothetical protein